MAQFLTIIAVVVTLMVAAVVPLYLLGRSLLNFKRSVTHRLAIGLKAIGSLVLWGLASFLLLAFAFAVFLGARDPNPAANALAVALRLVILSCAYALVGFALASWVRNEPD